MPRYIPTLAWTWAFTALMAVTAQIRVPMVPVPMTMQTFAVLLAGCVLGPAWGTASVLLYLALAAVGVPILSDGGSGLSPFFTGPTAGYLAAFPVAAALAGWAAQRGWLAHLIPGAALLFGLHLMILACGTLWLGSQIGLARAIAVGCLPFLVGAGVKSLLVALTQRPLRLWLWRT